MDDAYKIIRIPSDDPVYLEHLSSVRIFHEKWKIVSYVDLSEVDSKKNILLQCITKLKTLCIRKNRICKAVRLIDQLNRRIVRILDQKELVDHMLGRTDKIPTRPKHGLLNPIGEIGKILFGTLSDSDAEYYNSEIDKLHNDVQTVATLVKNQTQIIKTQILTNLDDMKSFNARLATINCNNELLANRTLQNELDLELEELIIELTSFVNEYGEDINNLMNAIADGRHGIVHPQLVPPNALFKKLEEALVSKDVLPVPLEVTSFVSLVDLSETTLACINNRLVYILLIPILENRPYDAYRVIPIAHEVGPSKFTFYDPPDEYIILNSLQSTFSVTTEDELDKCKNAKTYKLCKRSTPDYTVTRKDACLVNLLKSHSNCNSCTKRSVILQKTLWIQLKTNVQWIATVGSTEMLHILCPDKKLRNIEISGTFIITRQQDCQAVTEDIILKPEKM